ncbi:MAG: MBL fold metallo-hydrolase [Candidatus Methanosuratincola petrocarbonis]
MQEHDGRLVSLRAIGRLEITILCDNTVSPAARGMLGEHGFSALIRHGGEAVLFDTGQTGVPLINNMKALKIGRVEDAVLSHGHYDHSGGLPKLIESGSAPSRVFTHRDAFLPRFKKVRGNLVNIGMPFDPKILEAAGVSVIASGSPQQVKEWLITTGEIGRESFERPETEFFIGMDGKIEKDGFRDDMGIVAALDGKGLVVVTGCAHSGVINTVNHARKVTGIEEVFAVVGGFHLNDAGEEKLEMTAAALKEIGVKKVVPCHCTGFAAACHMRRKLGDAVEPGCVGKRIAL